MSDFRDVFFQSNPFTLKNKYLEWGPNAYDVVFFAEHHPNRDISRCPRTSAFLINCYGRVTLDRIGASPILNNGIVFATRNASLIYVSHPTSMLLEYNPPPFIPLFIHRLEPLDCGATDGINTQPTVYQPHDQ